MWTRFVWALSVSLVGMWFDSKHEFDPPTVFLELLLCPLMWSIFSQPLQCLPSYWAFTDLEHGVSPHSQSSEVQPLLLTLNVAYLLLLLAGPGPHSLHSPVPHIPTIKNGNSNIYMNNYFKCKWIKCSNQKTQTSWMDTNTRPVYMLSTRNPLQT